VSSPRRIGLPARVRMRHDPHFVDQLARPSGQPVGRMIPIEDLKANPNQPRQEIGDISELVASIKEKGVLEPILVRPAEGRFEIIAGERRYRAACEAGLDEIPCIVRSVGDAEMMELALIENLQRQDLTPFEEADGLKALAEQHGYTHEEMAEKLGKSRTAVTETLSLTAMPQSIRELCRLADISSKSLLLQVVRQSNIEKMTAFVQRLQKHGVTTRSDARRLAQSKSERPSRGRPRNYVFAFQPKGKTFSLTMKFKKTSVERDELIEALEGILAELRSGAE